MSVKYDDLLAKVAFSVFENRQVFALLLGSGVSRSAGIPTGWEITLDLVRRTALAKGIDGQLDWADWYRTTHEKEPEYSLILADLATTAAERRTILENYIEPTAAERELGIKVPTPAHDAIARLVSDGYLKIIITTNFDRLIENALREVGIEPIVVASVDALAGAPPMAHSRCYIVKLHGDYKDSRILNTEGELSSYPESFNLLLDRIIDEYGLIVCGWSGVWDQALRAAILRAPSRRYTTYWTTRGDVPVLARDLITHRKAIAISIQDSDTFFTNLRECVSSMASSQVRNPISVEVSVNSAKKYIMDVNHQIELDELFSSHFDLVMTHISDEENGLGGLVDQSVFIQKVKSYESACEAFCKIIGVMGRWGNGSELNYICTAIRSILQNADDIKSGGSTLLIQLRAYPAVLMFTAYCLGLTQSQRWQAFHSIFQSETLLLSSGKSFSNAELVFNCMSRSSSDSWWKWMSDNKDGYDLLSRHLRNLFNKWSSSFMIGSAQYDATFNLYEALGALAYYERYPEAEILASSKRTEGGQNGRYQGLRLPIGRFLYEPSAHRIFLNTFRNQSFQNTLSKAGFVRANNPIIDCFVDNASEIAHRLNPWM